MGNNNSKCHRCKKIIKTLPFKCRYCGEYYCYKHRIPEDHNCVYLKDKDKKIQERWKRVINESLINKEEDKNHKEIEYISQLHKTSYSKAKRKSFWNLLKIYFPAIIIILIILGIFLYSRGIYPNLINYCEDETAYNHCSKTKPLFCKDGELINNATKCGCPYGYKINNELCEKIPSCTDGTFYSECGKKPLYCDNGTLISKASICGCPQNFVEQEDECIDKYQINPKNITLYYTLRREDNQFNWTVYEGLNNYLSNIERSISYTYSEPTFMDFVSKNIDNEKQLEYLAPLVEEIYSLADNDDDRVRIAVSVVQNIPYPEDEEEIDRYAYQVLYDNKGLCGEKARLLVILLEELGYGVALIDYGGIETVSEYYFSNPYSFNHEAVGIKCPINYSYNGTGYCFIESTSVSMITDSNGDYPSIFCLDSDCTQKLPDEYDLTVIADGKSFESVIQEYNDAKLWNELNDLPGNTLSSSNYKKWKNLVNKYGIKLDH